MPYQSVFSYADLEDKDERKQLKELFELYEQFFIEVIESDKQFNRPEIEEIKQEINNHKLYKKYM